MIGVRLEQGLTNEVIHHASAWTDIRRSFSTFKHGGLPALSFKRPKRSGRKKSYYVKLGRKSHQSCDRINHRYTIHRLALVVFHQSLAALAVCRLDGGNRQGFDSGTLKPRRMWEEQSFSRISVCLSLSIHTPILKNIRDGYSVAPNNRWLVRDSGNVGGEWQTGFPGALSVGYVVWCLVSVSGT